MFERIDISEEMVARLLEEPKVLTDVGGWRAFYRRSHGGHTAFELRGRVVCQVSSTELSLKVWFNPVARTFAASLIYQSYRIYGLEVNKIHPGSRKCQKHRWPSARIHKHRWENCCKDKATYTPDDIPRLESGPIEVLKAFLKEASIFEYAWLPELPPIQQCFPI